LRKRPQQHTIGYTQNATHPAEVMTYLAE